MHITDSLVAYDTGFPGYNVPGGTGFPRDWQLAAGLRLSGNGIGVIDEQYLSSTSTQVRLYRVTAGPNPGDPITVSSAVNLSKDATDTVNGSLLAGASVVPGTSTVVFTTSNMVLQAGNTASLHTYTYDFSGTPSKISSASLPGSTFGGVGGGKIPIVALSPTLSVAVMNTNVAAQGLLGLAWQWAEGYIQIVSGVPQPITNVAAWHTSIVGSVAVGGRYYIIDAVRLSSTSFAVIAVQGGAGGTGVGQVAVLMQMDLSGNITSQTTVPSSIVSTSQGNIRGQGPRFQTGIDGSLYLSYTSEAATPAGGGQAPFVAPLDPTTGQPTGGTFHQGNIVPDEWVVYLCNASAIGSGQWFLQTRYRIFTAQQATTDWVSPGTAAGSFATNIDPAFWGASASRDFPTPPDLSPPGSVIGVTPGWNGSTGGELGDVYAGVFAMSATTAVCFTVDYTPGTTDYKGKAHTVFRVTTDPPYPRPPPPTIVTPYNGQMTPVFAGGFGPLPPFVYYVNSYPFDQLLNWAYSTVGVYVYSHGVFGGGPLVPPVTAKDNTYFIGLYNVGFGVSGRSPAGTDDMDQTSPYVLTVASINNGQPVYTQRFELQTYHTPDGVTFIYSEPLYTWRGGQIVWTYVYVPPTMRGKIAFGPQTQRPRILDRSTAVLPQSVTLGTSTSGVPSVGGNLQFGSQSVRPR